MFPVVNLTTTIPTLNSSFFTFKLIATKMARKKMG